MVDFCCKIGLKYTELLEEDQLSTSTFAQKFLRMAFPGCYRKLLVHPADLGCELHVLKQEGKESLTATLKFSLPPGSYATVLLNEITKSNIA